MRSEPESQVDWSLLMMNQPHDCVHHCELQRWHLHHDRKCDELSISHAYTRARTRTHMLWITGMYSAVGHIWCRLHISVQLKKIWSPWLNQYCTVFHLFQRRPSILFWRSSSVKQMLVKWNHLNSSPKHYKSFTKKKRKKEKRNYITGDSSPDIWKM